MHVSDQIFEARISVLSCALLSLQFTQSTFQCCRRKSALAVGLFCQTKPAFSCLPTCIRRKDEQTLFPGSTLFCSKRQLILDSFLSDLFSICSLPCNACNSALLIVKPLLCLFLFHFYVLIILYIYVSENCMKCRNQNNLLTFVHTDAISKSAVAF